jgi:hypothetical protein
VAREVRHAPRLLTVALVVVAVCAVPSAARAAPSPSAAAPGTVTVVLPPGTTVPAGTFDVTIRGSGVQVTGQMAVTPALSPGGTQPAATPGAVGGGADLLALTLVGVVVLVGVAFGVWRLRRLGPPSPAEAGDAPPEVGERGPSGRGYRAPRAVADAYGAALRLVDTGQYKEALPRLTRLEARLPDGLRLEAGFFVAFALYQIGDLAEAEFRLAALLREDQQQLEAAEMLAYIKVQRHDFDGAEEVLESLARDRKLTAGARKLYGIVEYQRALAALRDGNVDAAATLFERVQRLGDLRDAVPADLRNRHVLLGARALVDKDVPAARSHFEALEQAAGHLDAEHRNDLLVSAKLGLALAAWIEDAVDAPEKVKALLLEAIRHLDPTAPLTARWPVIEADSRIAEDLERLAESKSEERTERDLALRDMHFLRGMAALKAWIAAPDGADEGGLLADAIARFACARAVDPTFADAYLVVGLLRYRLAGPGARDQNVVILREARKRGAHDPELIRILNRHEPSAAGADTAAATALNLLDAYLGDASVRADIREALLRQRSRFGKPRDWDDRPDIARVVAEPTLSQLSDRAELLQARVRLMNEYEAGTALDGALQAADDLAQANERLAEQARAVERLEAAVLARIGDALLTEPRR